MNYQVVVHRLARQDLADAYDWAYQNAPQTADRWLNRFREELRSLESTPGRHPLASENRKVSVEVRELHFGRRPNVFRVIFHIDGTMVRLLRVLRAQRRWLSRREIDEAIEDDAP